MLDWILNAPLVEIITIVSKEIYILQKNHLEN